MIILQTRITHTAGTGHQEPGSEPPGKSFKADLSPKMKYLAAAFALSSLSGW